MNCIEWMTFLIIILTPVGTSSSLKTENSTYPPTTRNPKIKAVDVACSESALMGKIHLHEPFHGSLYVRQHPFECRSVGDGSREITLIFNVSSCGTKVKELPNGKLRFESIVYLQFSRKMQQYNDESIILTCTPQDLIVMSAPIPGPGMLKEKSSKRSAPKKLPTEHVFNGWLDVMHGTPPSLVPIIKPVHVGDNLTMFVKIKHPDGFDAKVVNCRASDGSDKNQKLLIDSNGCSVNTYVMPNLGETQKTIYFAKVMYTTFHAFRFPGRSSLHIRCLVIICNETCHQNTCMSTSGSRTIQPSIPESSPKNAVDTIEVFSSMELIDRVTEAPSKMSSFKEFLTGGNDELFCLNSTRILVLISVLLSVLMMSLVVTICMCVRAKELRRRLLHQNFPYGKVANCS